MMATIELVSEIVLMWAFERRTIYSSFLMDGGKSYYLMVSTTSTIRDRGKITLMEAIVSYSNGVHIEIAGVEIDLLK